MRVSTASSFDRITLRLDALQAESDALLAQIATGKRLVSPADAPADAAQVSRIARNLAEHAQSVRNIDTAATRLTLGDAALQDAGNVLDRAREVALAVAGDVANAADRAGAAVELAQLSDQLLAAANSRSSSGDWLFAGARSNRIAYVRSAAGLVTWQGSGLPPSVPLGGGRTVIAAEPASSVFENITTDSGTTSAFALIDELRLALTDASLGTAARRTALDRSINGLERASDQIGNARARYGARLAALDTERNSLRTTDVELTTIRGTLEDTDISAAAVSLSRAQLLLQATRDAFSRIGSLSLFDSLR